VFARDEEDPPPPPAGAVVAVVAVVNDPVAVAVVKRGRSFFRFYFFMLVIGGVLPVIIVAVEFCESNRHVGFVPSQGRPRVRISRYGQQSRRTELLFSAGPDRHSLLSLMQLRFVVVVLVVLVVSLYERDVPVIPPSGSYSHRRVIDLGLDGQGATLLQVREGMMLLLLMLMRSKHRRGMKPAPTEEEWMMPATTTTRRCWVAPHHDVHLIMMVMRGTGPRDSWKNTPTT
jgi:hypothetical protein